MLSTLFAQINNKALTPGMQAQQQDGVGAVTKLISLFITLLFTVGLIAFTFMFLIGAVKWITSGGDKGQVESARGQITQAITGLVVLFLTYAVATLIKTIFGIDLINIDISALIAK